MHFKTFKEIRNNEKLGIQKTYPNNINIDDIPVEVVVGNRNFMNTRKHLQLLSQRICKPLRLQRQFMILRGMPPIPQRLLLFRGECLQVLFK